MLGGGGGEFSMRPQAHGQQRWCPTLSFQCQPSWHGEGARSFNKYALSTYKVAGTVLMMGFTAETIQAQSPALIVILVGTSRWFNQ